MFFLIDEYMLYKKFYIYRFKSFLNNVLFVFNSFNSFMIYELIIKKYKLLYVV